MQFLVDSKPGCVFYFAKPTGSSQAPHGLIALIWPLPSGLIYEDHMPCVRMRVRVRVRVL